MSDELTVIREPSVLEKLGLTAEQFQALDVGQMERVFDFSLRVDAEKARRAWEEAFERAQRRITAIDIPKLSQGPERSRFAKTEAICKVIDPILSEEGFTWSFTDQPAAVDGHLTVVMLLRNSGHTNRFDRLTPAWDGRGPKGGGVMTPLAASGAVATYAERRLRMRVFGVHLTDDDNDGAAVNPAGAQRVSEEQLHDLESLIEEFPGSRPFVLGLHDNKPLHELTVDQAAVVVNALEMKRRAKR